MIKLYHKINKKIKITVISFVIALFLYPIFWLCYEVVLFFRKSKKQNIDEHKLQHKYDSFETKLKTQQIELSATCDLSIVIPAYNAEKTIEKCINSLICQKTKFNYEIIVVNDGSSDKTKEILETFDDKHLKVLHIENGGVANARNVGIKESHGRYLAFVDSDDYVEDGYIDKLMEPTKDGYDMVVCGFNDVFDGKVRSRFKKKSQEINVEPSHSFITDGYPWMKVIKREIFEHVCFPTGYHYEDTMMCYFVYPQVKKIKIIEDCLYDYVDWPISQTKLLNNSKNIFHTFWVAKYCLDNLKNFNISMTDELFEFTVMKHCLTILYTRTRTQFLTEDERRELFELSAMLVNNLNYDTKSLSKEAKKVAEIFKNYDFEKWNKVCKFARFVK